MEADQHLWHLKPLWLSGPGFVMFVKAGMNFEIIVQVWYLDILLYEIRLIHTCTNVLALVIDMNIYTRFFL